MTDKDKWELGADLILSRLRSRIAEGKMPLTLGSIGLLATTHQSISRWMEHKQFDCLVDLAADCMAAFIVEHPKEVAQWGVEMEKLNGTPEREVEDLAELDEDAELEKLFPSQIPTVLCAKCGQHGEAVEGWNVEPVLCEPCASEFPPDGAFFKQWVLVDWLPRQKAALDAEIEEAQDNPEATATVHVALEGEQKRLQMIESNLRGNSE